MKIAKLEALRLEVPLRWFQSYTDHGAVEDVELEALRKFPFSAGLNRIISSLIDGGYEGGYVGLCVGGNAFSRGRVNLFYSKGLSIETELFVRAHEETHALQNLGKLDFLEEAILKNQGVKVNLREMDRELSANIGGVYRVIQGDLWHSFNTLSRFSPQRCFGTANAYKIFQNCQTI